MISIDNGFAPLINQFLYVIIVPFIFLVVLPTLVRTECTCDVENEDHDTGKTYFLNVKAFDASVILRNN